MLSPELKINLTARTILELKNFRSNSFIQIKSKATTILREKCNNLGLSVSEYEISVVVDEILEKFSLSADVGIAVQSKRIKDDKWLETLILSFLTSKDSISI